MFERPNYIEGDRRAFYDLLPNHGLIECGYSDELGRYDISLDIDRARKFLSQQLTDLYSSPRPWEKDSIERFVNSTKFQVGDIKDPITGATRNKAVLGEYDRRKHNDMVFNLIQISPESVFDYVKTNNSFLKKELPGFTHGLPSSVEMKTTVMKAALSTDLAHELYHSLETYAVIYEKTLPQVQVDSSVILEQGSKNFVYLTNMVSPLLIAASGVAVSHLINKEPFLDPTAITRVGLIISGGIYGAFLNYSNIKAKVKYISEPSEEKARAYSRQYSDFMNLIEVKALE